MPPNILTKNKKVQVCGVKYTKSENHKIISEKTIIIMNRKEFSEELKQLYRHMFYNQTNIFQNLNDMEYFLAIQKFFFEKILKQPIIMKVIKKVAK